MSWQEAIQEGLERRDVQEKAYSRIIEHYRRLAQQTSMLKDRNGSLLKAASCVPNGPGGKAGESSSVARAYTASLETQLATLRDEMTGMYKTQSQNAQRLLVMNETLREREERSRAEEDELRLVRTEVARLRERVANHADAMKEKDRQIQSVLDELSTLQLEHYVLQETNAKLHQDNAGLVQRWLDQRLAEATRMNDANQFLLDAEKKGLPSQETATPDPPPET
ncbi:hypothetical protein CROQUDRAFT_68593 [Cronartium quercuum f. sp. fusiforme G11]|uniref:Autophagy-related protein 16 domain-containing protein n=1 Tax=Cronartium quercuum f. sp. fusiforme G11 TaxID=708437 RepID=A0A9P6T6N3_9BASI|nr:hypothetical protein CROQUDRAFT_68593 [Cronartium quercuum f. sp. fusiforme G11]